MNLDSYQTDEKATSKRYVTIFILMIGLVGRLVIGTSQIIGLIIGITLILTCGYVTSKNYKIGVRATFIVILFGVFSLIQFFPFSYGILFEFGLKEKIGIGLGLDFILVLVAIFHLWINQDEIQILPSESNEKGEIKINEYLVSAFISKFEMKDSEELKLIIEENKLTKEAMKAANEVYEKRIKSEPNM